jgi:hypothetical protein
MSTWDYLQQPIYLRIKELLIDAHLNKNKAIQNQYNAKRRSEQRCWKEVSISCVRTIGHLETVLGAGTELFQSEHRNTLILYLPGDHIAFHTQGWTGITMGL